MYAPCTNPFLKSETIDKMVDFYLHKMDRTMYDSVVSVTAVKEFLWQTEKKGANAEPATPINEDVDNPRYPRHGSDGVVSINFACCILPTALLGERRNYVGFKPYLWVIDHEEAFDIDWMLQFKLAEMMYKEQTTLD